MAENTEIASSPRKQENKSILSRLPKFQLNLPFFFNQQPKKAEETVVSKGTAKMSTVSEADDNNASSVKSSLARFPDATRPILLLPIELEAQEPAGRTSNPVVLWQSFSELQVVGESDDRLSIAEAWCDMLPVTRKLSATTKFSCNRCLSHQASCDKQPVARFTHDLQFTEILEQVQKITYTTM